MVPKEQLFTVPKYDENVRSPGERIIQCSAGIGYTTGICCGNAPQKKHVHVRASTRPHADTDTQGVSKDRHEEQPLEASARERGDAEAADRRGERRDSGLADGA